MSRTYRKPHLYNYYGLCHYYRLYLSDLVIGHVLHDSIDDVCKAFREVGNDPEIGLRGPHPHFPRGSPEYEAYWGEFTRKQSIRNLHAHVFRNRSSYRQRIKGIRLTKQLEHQRQRRVLARDLITRLEE